MSNSRTAAATCIDGIFRRMLCSDNITEGTPNTIENIEEPNVPPGVVGRLMGLDSVPKPNSISRSLSLDSIESCRHDPNKVLSQLRRVNSTTAFREKPSFFDPEEEEYNVFGFAKEGEGKDLGAKQRKQRKWRKNRGKKVSKGNIKEEICRRKKKNGDLSATDDEFSSENSSPVSVLEFDRFRGGDLNSYHCGWEEASPELENYLSFLDDDSLMDFDEKMRRIGTGLKKKKKKKKKHSKDCFPFWDVVCKLAETETKNATWISSHEDLEDVAADLEFQILDQLVDEQVVKLFGLQLNNFKL